MNIKLLKKRRRELFGESKSIDMQIPKEDLAAALSLVLENKPVTSGAILIKRMETNIELMDHNSLTYPFFVAIIQLYKKS